jgi:hypothetical protein
MRTLKKINGNGHTEDIKKNRGLYHPQAESTARDCYAPAAEIEKI